MLYALCRDRAVMILIQVLFAEYCMCDFVGSCHIIVIVCETMMMSSYENDFHIAGPLCGEYNGHYWIPLTKSQ